MLSDEAGPEKSWPGLPAAELPAHAQGWVLGRSLYRSASTKASIGMGVLATILIVLVSLTFFDISVAFLRVEMSIPLWKALLACFYGRIGEEVLFRLSLMTLMV
jgi:hypothetical protein